MDDTYVKSGALTIEELPDNSFKNIMDGEACNIGLKSKYEAECVRKFLWKRMMFIEPVSLALKFLLEFFTYVYIPCMVQFVVYGSVFTQYVLCMDNWILHMCKYGAWHNLLSMGQYLHGIYGDWQILFLDKFININVFCILLDKRRWQLHV